MHQCGMQHTCYVLHHLNDFSCCSSTSIYIKNCLVQYGVKGVGMHLFVMINQNWCFSSLSITYHYWWVSIKCHYILNIVYISLQKLPDNTNNKYYAIGRTTIDLIITTTQHCHYYNNQFWLKHITQCSSQSSCHIVGNVNMLLIDQH